VTVARTAPHLGTVPRHRPEDPAEAFMTRSVVERSSMEASNIDQRARLEAAYARAKELALRPLDDAALQQLMTSVSMCANSATCGVAR